MPILHAFPRIRLGSDRTAPMNEGRERTLTTSPRRSSERHEEEGLRTLVTSPSHCTPVNTIPSDQVMYTSPSRLPSGILGKVGSFFEHGIVRRGAKDEQVSPELFACRP